jgi:hypothetical protein
MLCLSDSQPDSARPKNVLGPIRAALRSARHSVSLKNNPGPIGVHATVSAPPLTQKVFLDLCSVRLSPRRAESTEKVFLDPSRPMLSTLTKLCPTRKMFMDLSRRCPSRSPNCAQPEKCSWTYPGIAPLVGPQTMHTGIIFADLSGIHSKPRLNPVSLKNVLGAIRNCLGPLYAWDVA